MGRGDNQRRRKRKMGNREGIHFWKNHITIEDAKAIQPSDADVTI